MNADGSGMRRLAGGVIVRVGRGGQPSAHPVSPPAWSPDGRWISFVSDRDANFEIYVMKADGSGQRNLTRNAAFDNDPVWYPTDRGCVLPQGQEPRTRSMS